MMHIIMVVFNILKSFLILKCCWFILLIKVFYNILQAVRNSKYKGRTLYSLNAHDFMRFIINQR